MKIGICTAIENIEKAEAYGFDYIEVGVGAIANLTDKEFAIAKELVSKRSIKPEAANGMLPGTFHICGEEANHEEVRVYLEHVFPRLAALGVTRVVFGSGGARRIPDGYCREKAWKELVACSKIVAEVAAKNGITIALEPLNVRETNIINSVTEGGKLVDAVAHKNFLLLVDYYHLGIDNEGYDGVRTYGKVLRHAHIAHPKVRTVPKAGDEGGYEEFFAELKSVGYDERVSIEGHIADFDVELPEASKYLKGFAVSAC